MITIRVPTAIRVLERPRVYAIRAYALCFLRELRRRT